MVGLVILFLPITVGYGIVAYFKTRNALAVRCAVWPAGAAGTALSFYTLYLSVKPELTEVDYIHLEIAGPMCMYLIPFMIGMMTGEYAALRSRFLFSEKTCQWLRSYTTKKRFSFMPPVQSFDDTTIDDVLNAKPVRKKKNAFALVLFLDSVPDGEHFLKITALSRPKTKLFSLKFGTPAPITVTLPISRRQVEEISEKFGPFKKTFFLMLSNRNTIRRNT